MLGITREKFTEFRKNGSLLTVLTVVGVIAGMGLGLVLREVKDDWTPREVVYLKFVGELFLRTLQALILPLIFSSLVDAVGSLDLTYSRKIGIRALLYYLSTTGIAAILGLVLAVSIQPGNRTDTKPSSDCVAENSNTVDTMLDLVRNIFPSNLVGATLEGTQTRVVEDETLPFDQRRLEVITVPGTNMLGLVVFAIILGLVLGYMKEAGKPVLSFFKSLGSATMFITSKVVSFSPVAICFLIASQLVEQDSIAAMIQDLAWYFATVISGLIIHGFIILPLSYLLLAKSSPLSFLKNMFQAMATAFGTASSSATLPVTLKCLEEKNGVNLVVSRFVIPIGATVNMNGAALYLPVATIYIAQLCGQTLSIGRLISLSLVSITSAIGAAGIPHMAMVVLVTVLNSQALPVHYVSMILPVEWILDRCVTVINILGDAFGAAIVEKLSKSDLQRMDLDILERGQGSLGQMPLLVMPSEKEIEFKGTIPRVKV